MKDEIKEILEALKPLDEEFAKAGIKEYPLYLKPDQQKILLDYITNLQEENKLLQANVKLLDDNRIYLNDKIDKAIEYIEYYCIGNNTIENKSHKTLLNILQGEDKDEFQENVNK